MYEKRKSGSVGSHILTLYFSVQKQHGAVGCCCFPRSPPHIAMHDVSKSLRLSLDFSLFSIAAIEMCLMEGPTFESVGRTAEDETAGV